ncbi:MaoC domain protein [Steroidobacter denitrificans]|uniref:MaoC domain protein n=1 Tax=Steroidobacter denitrificans TaxID=465721 RepID=A0A127F566_STEDE|nr:MaoC family dehydratase [Steroidobacter denitrificans]AMN45582.1 MaoC domain protein [Steroidobacter denitrificans]
MTQLFDSVAGVLAAVGRDLGVTEWMTLTQERINRFADATDDHQWIHVDEARAAEGPFGGCVAHGYLTLSLANKFLPELVAYEGLKMGVNYGCERVRFPAPVRAGSRIRGRGEVVAAEKVKGDGVQVIIRITVEIEGGDKPACVVDTISRLYF